MIDVVGLGMGPEGLTPEARALAEAAELLVGGRRQLALFPEAACETLAVTAPLDAVLSRIAKAHAEGRRVVVLADGDPLFHGIAATLVRRLGRDAIAKDLRIHPGVSSLQAAMARLGLAWCGSEPAVVSLHGRDGWEALFAAVGHHRLVFCLTDPERSPAALAKALVGRGAEGLAVHVLEDLAGPDERLRRLDLAEAAVCHARQPNVVVLERTRPPEVLLRAGLADHALVHQGGMYTKGHARGAVIQALALGPEDRLWDLGAGSGAVSLEAAALLTRGAVVAVEGEPGRAAHIRENRRRCQALHLEVVEGLMPAAIPKASACPDAVFLGGGARTPGVLDAALDALKPGGRFVATAILLDSLHRILDALTARGWPHEALQLGARRLEPLAGSHRVGGASDLFVVGAAKPEGPGDLGDLGEPGEPREPGEPEGPGDLGT